MITPLDIQNKEFARGVRGYKEEDVDSFLDLLTIDMEKIISENAGLKEAVRRLESELEKYRSSEMVVVETLEAAKGLMRDIAISSEKRAEVLLKNAELDAELITREAKESIERLSEESITLKHRFLNFRSKYKTLLETELERFDSFSNEVFSEFEEFAGAVGSKKAVAAEEELKTGSNAGIVSDIEKGVDDIKNTMINLRIGDGAK